MFAKIGQTWSLMGGAWEILKKDKELLVFPVISGIACLAVMASFAIPMVTSGAIERIPSSDAPPADHIAYYGVLFLFYWTTYFVIVFFNTAVVACAVKRIAGGNPTLGDGFSASFARLGLILGWSALAATVGIVLRILEDRSKGVARFVTGFLGIAWSLASYLAIPVLVVERKGPLAALKESAALLKKTWGNQLVGNFSFGFVFFLLAIPGIALAVFGFGGIVSGQAAVGVLLIGIGAAWLLLMAIVQSTLQIIFQAVLYVYARDGVVPAEFDPKALAGVFD